MSSPPEDRNRDSEISGVRVNEQDASSAAVNRIKASLLTLDVVKAAVAKSDPFDLLTPNDQAFIGFAKMFTLLGFAMVNALNIFGTHLILAPGYSRVDKFDDGKRVNQKHLDEQHQKLIRTVFVCFTILSMPFTVSAAGVAHATEHLTSWINFTSVMLFFESALMATLSGLYAYYLTDIAKFFAIFCSVSLCAVFWCVVMVLFRRLSLLCTGARLKKDVPASVYFKKVIEDNNLKDPQVMAKWLEEMNVP